MKKSNNLQILKRFQTKAAIQKKPLKKWRNFY